jgi:hypothetical protein
LNGSYRLNSQTVSRDAAVNQFIGGSGLDWFWFSAKSDKISNFGKGEVVSLE